ncbi:hypothetical protein F5B20DRAFT_256972 [Whalleya microplaca]|nr:hypothetical protein F5B20DRAFT_256972 [Whalleya microplaca]
MGDQGPGDPLGLKPGSSAEEFFKNNPSNFFTTNSPNGPSAEHGNSTSQPSSTEKDTNADDTLAAVSVGPGGRDPSIMVPRILNFLRDEDSYRHPAWHSRLDLVDKYLEEANEGRLRGDLGYNDPKLCAALKDARIIVDVHRNYDKWNNDKSRWSTDILAGKYVSDRLPSYPAQFPRPLRDRSQYRRKRIEHLPRTEHQDTPFGETGLPGEAAESTLYSYSEDNYFQDVVDPHPDGPRGPSTYNRYRVDVSQYEQCMKGGIQQTVKLTPPNLAPDGTFDQTPSREEKKGSTSISKSAEIHSQRGWERAALQQCLNAFTNHENRAINTPWRRAVLPYKEPVPMPKEIVYQPRVLNPDNVPENLKDPFPWFYWYSQYSQLIDYMAGWQRRRHNVENWNDAQRSALPMNFRGPHTYLGLSIYDDHWLKIGQYLEDLEELLDERYGVAPRPLLMAILRDISAGKRDEQDDKFIEADEAVDLATREGLKTWHKRYRRRDIMRRNDVDYLDGNEEDYLLTDEVDAAWLRFLCQPSRTHQMCDPQQQPEDNLTILFSSRLQSYLNDTMMSGTVGAGGAEIWGDWNDQEWEDSREEFLPYLSQALAYTNGGEYFEDKDTNWTVHKYHPNRSYQFSAGEAREFCLTLHGLGRCEYLPASKPEQDPRVGRPRYDIHPEHRIRWRYKSSQEFDSERLGYSKKVLEHLNKQFPSITQSEKDTYNVNIYDEYAYILDHVGDSTLATRFGDLDLNGNSLVKDGETSDKKRLVDSRVGIEYDWVKGEYDPDSVEMKRQAPSFEDLADWKDLAKFHTQARGSLRTPEKTCHFLRSLAFRMGRTIRHANEIKDRLEYWQGSGDKLAPGEKEGLKMGKAISLDGFHQALEHWEQSIHHGVGEVEFMPPTIQAVIEKADPNSTFRIASGNKDPYTIVREGIIHESVENRNTLYPARLEGLEDSSYWNEKRSKLFIGYQRPNLFSWATKAQRQYQAKFTRRTYFSMMRWPLHHQSTMARDGIKGRMEEVARRDPRKQRYGILTHRVPQPQEKPTYIVASGRHPNHDHPSSSVPRSFRDGTRGRLPEWDSSLDTAAVSELSLRGGANEVTSPSKPPRTRGHRDDPRGGLVPITRENERFFAGPAIFPMGESLLQQVAISQQLENALYPKPKLPWYKWLWENYLEIWTAHRLVPLLPPIAPAMIARSSPNKRRVPDSFLADTNRRPTKRPNTAGGRHKVKRPAKGTRPRQYIDVGVATDKLDTQDRGTSTSGLTVGTTPNQEGENWDPENNPFWYKELGLDKPLYNDNNSSDWDGSSNTRNSASSNAKNSNDKDSNAKNGNAKNGKAKDDKAKDDKAKDDKAKDDKAKGGNATNKQVTFNLTHTPPDKNAPGPSPRYRQNYDETFPYGATVVNRAPEIASQYGISTLFRSLIEGIEHQHPDIKVIPTMDELWEIHADIKLNNSVYLPQHDPSQIANYGQRVLELWGADKGLNMQIAISAFGGGGTLMAWSHLYDDSTPQLRFIWVGHFSSYMYHDGVSVFTGLRPNRKASEKKE